MKIDFDGHLIAFEITGGDKADAPMFETLTRIPARKSDLDILPRL